MLTVAFIHCEKQHTDIHNSEDGQLQVDVSCIFSHNEFLIRRFMAHFFFFGTPPLILPLNVSRQTTNYGSASKLPAQLISIIVAFLWCVSI